MADQELVTMLRSIRSAIDVYLQHAAGNASAVSGALVDALASAGIPVNVAAGGPQLTDNGRSASEQVRAELMKELMERTGYPEDLLEPDLDLEGDLGVDTVKQVAALAAVRERFGLDIDPNFRLRDHNTIRKMVTHIAGRLEHATL